MDKPLYAGPAARQLRRLTKALNDAADRYHALSPELRPLVDSHVEMALSEDPLLRDSLSSSERPVLTKLLGSSRFQLGLRTVGHAAAFVAVRLVGTGKPVDPRLLYLPDSLPARVRDAVRRAAHSAHRPFGDSFPATGAPKDTAVRYYVALLWPIYQEKTGKQPTVYPSPYRDKHPDGYAGEFYNFAKETLSPARLVPKKSLPNAIFRAYKDLRALLVAPNPRQRKNRKSSCR